MSFYDDIEKALDRMIVIRKKNGDVIMFDYEEEGVELAEVDP